MSNNVPMTQEGYAKLQREAAEMESRRPAIKAAIAAARAHGDLRENADYHAAREELAMLNARLSDIHTKLSRAVVIDPSQAPSDKAFLGSKVTIKRVSDGETMTRTLVGQGEQDLASGKILTTSPVGQAVVGHGVGEVVIASLPNGDVEFEIVDLS
ncbi:MAG: transcription elongation factor GreA [Planctomycetes bacterium]|nr:transcription elongation factor GreA [Planctomycetota bacterium]